MAKLKPARQGRLIESTAELRKMLIETINDVRAGDMSPPQARTIAALSTTILQSAKLDLDFLRFHAANESLNEAGRDVVPLLPHASKAPASV